MFDKIKNFLIDSNVEFDTVHHAPTYTSEESAKARGEALQVGAKAILMKLDETFVLFVLSAAKKLDSKKIKKLFNVKSIRFANAEELFNLTSLVPGSVPPFGDPVLPFKLYIDLSISELPKVAFNAGSLTDSILLNTPDYLKIARGELCSISL